MPSAPERLRRPAAVLFDMDGTLVQSRQAVWQIFRPINDEFDLGIQGAEDFYEIFTQNLLDGMATRCRDRELARRVVDEFFQRLKEHYRPQFVPGMAEVIRALAATTTLAVVTTNLMEVVRDVLVEHGVATCFAHVFSGDVEPSKAKVISHLKTDAAYTLARHCAPYYDEAASPSPASDEQLVMVTDTSGDVRAAKSQGIQAIGVSWGMHSDQRLVEAGADAVALWPQELLSLLSQDAKLSGDGDACATACAAPEPGDAVAAVTVDAGPHAAGSAVGAAETPLERVRQGNEVRRARSSDVASLGTCGPVAYGLGSNGDPRLDAAVRRILAAPSR